MVADCWPVVAPERCCAVSGFLRGGAGRRQHHRCEADGRVRQRAADRGSDGALAAGFSGLLLLLLLRIDWPLAAPDILRHDTPTPHCSCLELIKT